MLPAIAQAPRFPEGPLTARTTSYAAVNKETVHLTSNLKVICLMNYSKWETMKLHTLNRGNKQNIDMTCNLLLQNKEYG